MKSLKEQILEELFELDGKYSTYEVAGKNELRATAERIASLVESLIPERITNDFLESRKLTPYRRMKQRAYTKGFNEAIDLIKSSLHKGSEEK